LHQIIFNLLLTYSGGLCYFYTMEIERKYLVDSDKWNKVTKPIGVPIIQGYLCSLPDKTIRVRIKGNQSYMTIKGKSMGISREEIEFEIPSAQAQELITNFCGTTIEKERYNIDFAGKTWDVDVFKDENAGLIIAEIELTDENESFLLPDWVDQEVSHDIRYFNSYLAEHPFCNWKNNNMQ